VTDLGDAVNALWWAVEEVEARYRLISRHGARDLAEYNLTAAEGKIPHCLIVIDEFADLIMRSKEEIESAVVRIGQKGRAAGVSLLLATQSPKREIVTGVLRANLPARIALRTATSIDSRLILEVSGAEQLLGQGDAILADGTGSLTRFQSAFIENDTLDQIVEAWRSQVETEAEPENEPEIPPDLRRRKKKSRVLVAA
jgi:DNA segregation ATPase FtsK/SpoIIIE, S-DNA-T family